MASAAQISGDERREVRCAKGLAHTLPAFWRITFRAMATMAQKTLCQDTGFWDEPPATMFSQDSLRNMRSSAIYGPGGVLSTRSEMGSSRSTSAGNSIIARFWRGRDQESVYVSLPFFVFLLGRWCRWKRGDALPNGFLVT